MRLLAVAALLLVVTGFSELEAQLRSCNLGQRPGAPDAVFTNAGQPNQVVILYQAVITCEGGLRMEAETATYSQASGITELFGNVVVTDPQQILRAGRATYFSRLRQLSAQENVVVTQRATGSRIRADLLNHYELSPQRPQALTVGTQASGPLARAVLFADSAQPGVARDSTIVDAREIQIVGESLFRGTGDAVLTRDSLRATAYQIEYRQDTGQLQVLGGGLVTLPSYELRGDSITATLGEDDEIREVLTRHGSSLQSEDMEVTAPAIRMFFESGGIERMVAMNWTPMQNALAGPRPVAVSEQFRMEADSLDVLAPGQQVTEAAAIGGAYVERVTPDSLRQYLPEVEANVLALIRNDWMRGDTVRAWFVAAAPADAGGADVAADAGRSERVMERLTASGGPAQAMHRMRPEGAEPGTRLALAYLIGSRVKVAFEEGIVALVTAAEDVRGVYLQPREAARRTTAAGPGRNQ
jgi:lipopolysaccharide export system protein LptA